MGTGPGPPDGLPKPALERIQKQEPPLLRPPVETLDGPAARAASLSFLRQFMAADLTAPHHAPAILTPRV